mgnify:CR=1 FL=1
MITVGTDFSGLGAPEMALKELGIEHRVLFACEKDKYAKASYNANHEAEIFYDDVTTRDNEKAPEVDLYCFGFPCQAFSISGKRNGFDDVRGTLFFNSAEYIRLKRPKVFIAENVKGLLSHDKPKNSKAKHGRTFSTIINLLAKTINGQILMPMYEDNLGYNVYYTVLNSKYYDVPQNRERIFIVGFRDDVDFAFPQSKTVTKRLKDILEPVVDEKYYLSDKMLSCLLRRNDKNYENHNGFKTNFLNEENIANTLRSNYHKMTGDMDYIEEPVCAAMRGRYEDNSIEQKLEERTDGVTNTLTSVQKDNLIIVNDKSLQPVKLLLELIEDFSKFTSKNYGTETSTHATKILQTLLQTVSSATVSEWGTAILTSLQSNDILQSEVYDSGIYGKRKERQQFSDNTNQQSQGTKNDSPFKLLYLWKTECNRCTPQGREPIKQLIRKFTEDLSLLSHKNSPEGQTMFSIWMQWQTQRSRLLRETLSAIQNIRQSNDVQGKSIFASNYPKRIRRLSPLEAFRLQGFSDDFFYKCNAVNSDTQLYKQAGNSITVNVLKAIIKNIKFTQ